MSLHKKEDNFKNLVDRIHQRIKNAGDVTELRSSLEKCDRKDLHTWVDDKKFDILHHAILASNIEAVGMIFALGLFKPPHEPKCHPYLHLAANVSHRAIVSMLLQERPGDNQHLMYQWVSAPKHGPGSGGGSGPYTSRVSPLDVAGDSGQVGCVTTILDFYRTGSSVRSETDTHLCRACKCSSPSALRLLLAQSPREEDVKAAVGTALKMADPECLDVLLRCNPRLTSLFRGMNLYHVLYSYSLSFRKEWYESLLTVTSVLLKHRQNPVCAVPFRTYPLYSLLSHRTTTDFGKASPYLIACLVLLLNAGVDPNFNEEAFEKENQSRGVQAAFGRACFPSALHCLFDAVGSYAPQAEDVDTLYVRRHLVKCVETLLRHNADPAQFGTIGEDGLVGNALHAFLKIWLAVGIEQRTMATFMTLLKHGSDPDLKVSGQFPINVYCNEILTVASAFDGIPKSDVAEITSMIKDVAFILLNVMSHEAMVQAAAIPFDGKPTSVLQRQVFKVIKDAFMARAGKVWSLKHLCKVALLVACRRKEANVLKLPLPPALTSYVSTLVPT